MFIFMHGALTPLAAHEWRDHAHSAAEAFHHGPHPHHHAAAAAKDHSWRPSSTCPKMWIDPYPKTRMTAYPGAKAAIFLGTQPTRTGRLPGATQSVPAPQIHLPAEGACKRLGEQRVFEATCAETIAAMDGLLAETRNKRALLIEYSGRSVWGLGHVLSYAYGLHYMCRRLRRYCYIRLWDLQLEDLFTYANGESWSPSAANLSAYESAGVRKIERKGRDTLNFADLYESLRNETAALIHVRQIDATPMVGSESLPWLLPLVAAATRADSVTPFDRCFCRYVTRTSFGPAGNEAVGKVLQRLRSSGTQSSSAVLHLRTGFADVAESDIERSVKMRKQGGDDPAGVRKWFGAACNESAISEFRDALIISDAPGLLQYMRTTHPGLYTVPSVTSPTARHLDRTFPCNASTMRPVSTRSWGNAFPAKLQSAVDAAAAGLMDEVHISRYSSMMKPAVARSMCVRRVLPFADNPQRICPQFEVAFFRNLHVLTAISTKWSCVQKELATHPCKDVPGHYCRLRFAAALGPPLRDEAAHCPLDLVVS